MLGSSRRLSVSTTTTIGILTAAEVSQGSLNASAAQAAATVTTLAVLVGLALVTRGGLAARVRGAVHLRAGPHRIQGWHRHRDRRGSDPEAVRAAPAQGLGTSDHHRIVCEPAAHVPSNADACGGHDRSDAAHLEVRTAGAISACGRDPRYRGVGAARAASARCRDDWCRFPPACRPSRCPTSTWRCCSGQERSGSRS